MKRFIQETIKSCPGFVIEVQDGKVRLEHIFTAGMWQQGEPIKIRKYKKLRDRAEKLGAEIELPAMA